MKKKYQVPTIMMHKIWGTAVMIGNSGTAPDVPISDKPDPNGNDPNDSRSGCWDDGDDGVDGNDWDNRYDW